MEFWGYVCSVIIGLTLGVLGSGGSILTVPVLVYLLHFNPIVATGYSLFIVGLTSLTGAFSYMRKELVDYKTALVFALPSFISVYVVRRFMLPLIPPVVFQSGGFLLSKEMLIMLVFALLMIAAAFSMIRNKYDDPDKIQLGDFNYSKILMQGFIVGAITGLVSVGGGFLIIPSLVLFARIPIKMAVGTSLVIIASNAFIGFIGDLPNQQVPVDWMFLFKFCVFSIVGIILGSNMVRYIPGKRLKPVFGWFILVMGCYIVIHELFIQ